MSQPLRPIDAIFVHLKGRFYVVYHRGTLWQLPRMKLDRTAWQHKKPYLGDKNALFLSRQQAVLDINLAKQLRTLELPAAIQGAALPKFEAWWQTHGFFWLKDSLQKGTVALASNSSALAINRPAEMQNNDHSINQPTLAKNKAPVPPATVEDTIFADMLADLTDEVLNQQH